MIHTSLAISIPVPGTFSVAGSEAPSLMSEKEDRVPASKLEVWPLRRLNFTFLGFVILG